MIRSATISPCGRYRYRLRRVWGTGGRICTFVMLNPSKADGELDDATIRRCIAFCELWGFNELEVVNLYAWRATSPSDLEAAYLQGFDTIGPDNNVAILEACAVAELVIFAWGANAGVYRSRDVAQMLLNFLRVEARCLGFTIGNRMPRHPLYIPKGAAVVPY